MKRMPSLTYILILNITLRKLDLEIPKELNCEVQVERKKSKTIRNKFTM
jgi:hypothetical protein